MKKIAKILVPVDFSDTAMQAYHFAQQIAIGAGAELHLLHVTYPQMENIDEPLAPSRSATEARTALLEERMQEFSAVLIPDWEKNSPPSLHLHVEIGAIIPVIRKRSRLYDLIVMGTRGEHKRVENLLGTVAADVVIHASCPVIVVPQYADRPEINRIAHALDLRWVNAEMLMQWSGLLRSPEGIIHLVYFGGTDDHVIPGELQELQKSLQLHLPDSSIQTHKLHKHELVGDLSLFCDQHHIDLLIMYRGRNSWKRKLFHRSLTRQMAGKTKIPLLIL